MSLAALLKEHKLRVHGATVKRFCSAQKFMYDEQLVGGQCSKPGMFTFKIKRIITCIGILRWMEQ